MAAVSQQFPDKSAPPSYHFPINNILFRVPSVQSGLWVLLLYQFTFLQRPNLNTEQQGLNKGGWAGLYQ